MDNKFWNQGDQSIVTLFVAGFVRYTISFSALMFRPFKNEIIQATVKAVSDVRSVLAPLRVVRFVG